VIVGVDAGASHTEVVVADDDGTVLTTVRGAPGALGPGRTPTAITTITDTMRQAVEPFGTDPRAIVVGAAGAGSDDERLQLEDALVQRWGTGPHIAATTDVHIALDAAFPGTAGIVVIAGTGSIALARDPAGRLRRTGGYGPHVGDDAGAYSLVRDALGRAARWHDRRDPGGAGLLHHVLRERKTRAFDDVVRWAQGAGYAEVASLAVLVAQAADDGDAAAAAAVDACADRLAELVEPLAKPFAPDAPTIALAGGMLAPGSVVREALAHAIGQRVPDAGIIPSAVEPALGALWQARRALR
jgi:glucosamine kinase